MKALALRGLPASMAILVPARDPVVLASSETGAKRWHKYPAKNASVGPYSNTNMRALITSLLLSFLVGAWAQSVPPLMNYQGRLTDQSGQPLPNGTYAVQFRLWNRGLPGQPGEALVWGRQYDVTLRDGVFNVILGAEGGAPLLGTAVNDLHFAFGDPERYLGLTLTRLHDGTLVSENDRKEIQPRQQLLSTPFAFLAGNLGSGAIERLSDALIPPGTVMAFAGNPTDRPGWLVCDGRSVNSVQYPKLWDAIHTSWGGTGAADFRLPDLRGIFLRGLDTSPARGVSGRDPDRERRTDVTGTRAQANAVGSYQADDLKSHNHQLPTALSSFQGPANGVAQMYRTDIANSGSVSVTPVGGSETRPKNAYVVYMVKY